MPYQCAGLKELWNDRSGWNGISPSLSLCSYASKLQEQLVLMAGDVFPAAHDQERIRSVLSDLAKTAADFRDIAGRAIDHLSTGSLLQLR